MTATDKSTPPPWYRQFWPWFLISIPAATIIASMITIKLAVVSNDGLVSENYYKEGLAIHRDADALLKARQLGIQAKVSLAVDRKSLDVGLISKVNQAYGKLEIALRHPTRAHQDINLALQPVGPNHYRADLSGDLVNANWIVELNAPESGWQLHGRLDIQRGNELLLR